MGNGKKEVVRPAEQGRGSSGNGDDIRAIINKYLPPSVQLRESREVSRPKVRAPGADLPHVWWALQVPG